MVVNSSPAFELDVEVIPRTDHQAGFDSIRVEFVTSGVRSGSSAHDSLIKTPYIHGRNHYVHEIRQWSIGHPLMNSEQGAVSYVQTVPKCCGRAKGGTVETIAGDQMFYEAEHPYRMRLYLSPYFTWTEAIACAPHSTAAECRIPPITKVSVTGLFIPNSNSFLQALLETRGVPGRTVGPIHLTKFAYNQPNELTIPRLITTQYSERNTPLQEYSTSTVPNLAIVVWTSGV